MLLIIRGHIRDSFETKSLYHFIKDIYVICPKLKIYIHTWCIIANNISWRRIKINNTTVTKEIIYNYFDDLKHLIEYIIIDDDKQIKLIGNLNGKINNGLTQIFGWKNYWYGKYRIIEHIYNKNINNDIGNNDIGNNDISNNDMVLNLRFDIMKNSNDFSKKEMINFIQSNIGKKITKNVFICEKEVNGIDNIYIGNVNTMYKLSHYFHHELDEILSKNRDTIHQERLVYRINNQMFIDH